MKELIMKPCLNTYYYVSLRKGFKYQKYAIHRLVCLAFLPNPENFPCVNHKDYNPLNNSLNNLEWCTYEYNNNYGRHSQMLSDSRVEKYGTEIDVYSKKGVFIKSYHSIRDAVNEGFFRDSISKCCRGELNSHKGLVFKYKGEPFEYKNRKLNVRVKKYDDKGVFIREYFTIREAAEDNNITKDKLGSIYRGIQPNIPINGFRYEFYPS